MQTPVAAALLDSPDGAARRRRGLGTAHDLREFRRHQRQFEVRGPERIGNRVGDADRGRHAIAFADALRAERREWRRRLHVENDRIRYLRRRRQQVVREGSGQKAAIGGIGVFLVERSADGLGKAAADLSVDHGRVQDCPAVMHGHVAVDPRLQGRPIDLDAAKIEDEAVAERGVDVVGFVRRGQFRRAPEYGFADRLSDAVGQRGGRPVAQPRDAGERNLVVGIAPRSDVAAGERDVLDLRVQLARGDACQPSCNALRGEPGGAGDGRRETAGVVAGRDRPGVLGGIDFGIDPDVGGLQPEHVGHDLRQNGAMALPLRHRGDVNRYAPDRIDRDRRGGLGAVLRPGLAALGRRQHGRDVAHVGHARLDHGGIADAVELALRARRIAARFELGERTLVDAAPDRFLIIAGVEQRAARGPVRKRIGANEIARDDVERIEAELDRDALNQTLEREIDLRAAEPAIQSRRRLVGDDDAVADREMTDVVGAGQVAVHAIERRRLRCAQMRAAILDLIPVEREDTAVVGDRRRERGGPVGGGNRRGQMLEPILDPFDRPSRRPRGRGDQDDVGKNALLDAKAAAGIRWRAQPQAVARNLERPRHHRMDAEGTLEIGEHVVGVVARVIFGDHAIGFDRRAGIARVANVDADPVRGLRKGLLRIAVAKRPVAGDIARKAVVQNGRVGAERRQRIDHRRPRLVPDVDQINRVFRQIAIGRNDDRYGLADIAHAPNRDRPAFDRRLDADDQARRQRLDILAMQDRNDAGRLLRRGQVD